MCGVTWQGKIYICMMVFHCKQLRMGVEVRGPGQEGVEEGDQVAGVNTPIILR